MYWVEAIFIVVGSGDARGNVDCRDDDAGGRLRAKARVVKGVIS